MALVGSSVRSLLQMDRRRSTASSQSLDGSVSSRSSLKEKELDEEVQLLAAEAPTGTNNKIRDGKVYLAVGKDFKMGKMNLIWVLKNTPRTKKIVIVHVHVPSPVIPLMGAWFPADQVKPEQVKAYRQVEKNTMEKAVNAYLNACSSVKEVQSEKLVIEADDIGQGLLRLISQQRITKLVMGAAADKFYAKKMKEPKSKKALMLQQQADSSCKLWFVCKGHLICTREAVPHGFGTSQTVKEITSRQFEEKLEFSPQTHGQYFNFHPEITEESFNHASQFETSGSHEEAMMPGLAQNKPGYFPTAENKDGFVIDLWDGLSKSSRGSGRSNSNNCSVEILKDEEIEEDAGLDDEFYRDLKHAVMEAKNLTREAYEESLRRQKAEKDLMEAAQKAKATEDLYSIEIKQRKQIEERLLQEKRELEQLSKQRDEMFEELRKEHEQRVTVQLKLADSKGISKHLEKKLTEAHRLLISLQQEHVKLQRERDDAVQEAKQLRQKLEEMADRSRSKDNLLEFSYSELEEATNKFDDAVKIGEGGYGSVYKGAINNKTVAIKMLNSQGLQGEKEFHKEVNVLSRLRHPNLVQLMGVCTQSWALVYEFLPNGSLEDRLSCKDNTPPLSWQVRVRIATEICSALNFLHSNKEFSVVHGDLKPANILLDADFGSKLGDFGISGLLLQSSNNSTALYRCTHAMGTFVYMDPEFLACGDLRPSSDVYSLGIIILRLLTGRTPFRINRVVQEAVERGCLREVVDASAGDWPNAEAEQLAQLGLRCCEIARKSRPEAREALRLLEALTETVPKSQGLPALPPA